jgi:lipopolysaccharide transport system permease protein
MAGHGEGARTIRITPPPRWVELNLADVWAHRELLYFLVWRQLKLRYKQTVIGAGWAIPAAIPGTACVVVRQAA